MAHSLPPNLPERMNRWGVPLPRLEPGIGTGLWGKDFRPVDHLPAAAAAGFASIELNLYRPDDFDASNRRVMNELRQVLADCGMSVASIHAPDGGHLGAADPMERRRQMDILRACVEVADSLDAATVVSHALLLLGSTAPPDTPATDDRIAEALDELAPLVESLPVRIAFENGRGNQPGTFARDVLRRLNSQSSAAFGFALDTGHANIAGDLACIVNEVGPRLISLHLNDNDGQRDRHMPPGEGTVDWPEVNTLLRNIRFQGCIMYELLGGAVLAEERMAQTMRWHRSHTSAWPKPMGEP